MQAESIYQTLLKEHVKPEIYRGLFRLYQADDRMSEVLRRLERIEQRLTG